VISQTISILFAVLGGLAGGVFLCWLVRSLRSSGNTMDRVCRYCGFVSESGSVHGPACPYCGNNLDG